MPEDDKELCVHIVQDFTPYEMRESPTSERVFGYIYGAEENCGNPDHRTADGTKFKHTHVVYTLPVSGVIDVFGGEEETTADETKINAYWEFEYEPPLYSSAGSFAPSKGFERILTANVKYNCIAQGLDYPTAWIEPGDKGIILEKDYEEVPNRSDMETGKQYVIIGSTHAAKITTVDKEGDRYTVDEKNADSGVYRKTYTLVQLNEKFNPDYNYKIYKKKN